MAIETAEIDDLKLSVNDESNEDWQLSDLYEYFSWNCPLNDGNILCTITREIISFAGNDLILSCFNPKNIDPFYFNFNVGCVSNDGIFYIHHNYKTFFDLNQEKNSKMEHGLSRIPLYSTKLFSQRVIFNLKARWPHGWAEPPFTTPIKCINVLSTKSTDSNYDQRSNLMKIIKQGNRNYDKGDNMDELLNEWHKMVTNEISFVKNDKLSLKKDTKKYKLSKKTFLFWIHNFKKLFFYCEMFPIVMKNNKIHDKCVEIDIDALSSGKAINSSEEKDNDENPLKIVHFWRQDEVLYILRGKVSKDDKKKEIAKEKMVVPDSQTDVVTQSSGNEEEPDNKEKETEQETEEPAKKKKNSRGTVKTPKSGKNSKAGTKKSNKKKGGKGKKGKKGKKGDNMCQLFQITLNKDNINKFNEDYNGKQNKDKSKNANNSKNKNQNKNKGKNGGLSDKLKMQLMSNINSLIDCKKLITFEQNYINPNCSYYDEKTQSLLIAYNNDQTENLELRIYKSKQINNNNTNINNKNKTLRPTGAKNSKSNSTTSKSSKKNGRKSPRSSPRSSPRRSPRSKGKNKDFFDGDEVLDNMANYTILSMPQEMNESELFDYNTQCHYLFYHKCSDSIILLIKHNNQRLFIQLRIDFMNNKILSIKRGIINIKEEKCKIVCYDDIRNCVIIEVREPSVVNFGKIEKYSEYIKYRNRIIYGATDDGSDEKDDKGVINDYEIKREIEGPYTISRQFDEWKDDSYFFNDFEFKTEIDSYWFDNTRVTFHDYYRAYCNFNARKQTNFRVIRLNDMVNKWKTIF